MEIPFYLLLVIAVLGWVFVSPIVLFGRISQLRREIDALTRRLAELEQVRPTSPPPVTPAPEPAPPRPVNVVAAPPLHAPATPALVTPSPVVVAPPPALAAPPPAARRGDAEQWVG